MNEQYNYDVIVVGAGHNGLIVAAYLAKAGLNVGVIEKNNFIGGSTNTLEVTLPGFKHDIGGIGHVAILGNPLIVNDELGLLSKYGLKYITPEIGVANVFADNTAIHLSADVDAACQDIAEFSQHDAEAYKKFITYGQAMLPLLGQGMYNAAPPFGMFMHQLDQSPIGQELIRFLMMSAWDVASQWFEHPKTMMSAMKFATEPMVGPEEKGTGVWLLMMLVTQHVSKSGLPIGGSGALAKALADCIEANGGTVRTNSEVTKILTKGDHAYGVKLASGEEITARRAVVSNVDPRLTILKWLDTGVSADLRDKVSRIAEPSFSGMLQAIALDEMPRYKASDRAQDAMMVEPLPNDLEDFRSLFDDLRYGKIPQKGFAPIAVTPTVHDPSRAPEGKHVLYLWHYVPYFLKDGGPQKWDSIKEDVADMLLDKYLAYTSNLSRKNVLKRTVFSPLDHERWNANLINGAVLGPGSFLYQNFAYRPIPELGQYKTPVNGLYLCGMSTHPGASIIGGGRAAAQVIMQDLGLDFDDVVS